MRLNNRRQAADDSRRAAEARRFAKAERKRTLVRGSIYLGLVGGLYILMKLDVPLINGILLISSFILVDYVVYRISR